MRSTPSALLSQSVPRYTSYPTAPHFHAGIDCETARRWLGDLPREEPVSLYVHIPYCDRLCWFCACHTKQTRQYAPVAAYLEALLCEVATIGRLIKAPVKAIHFGGGSPTMLTPEDMKRLGEALKGAFDCAPDLSLSVEMDPNDMDEARFDALAEISMSRASLGIQDFDPVVQKTINRIQSLEDTAWVVEGVRARGARSVNFDLLYGLPHQTVAGVGTTIRQALSLKPDRLALFGYAHVPWFKKHQTMIDEASLPDAAARLAQAEEARRIILAAGYRAIGIDHFALPADNMAIAAENGRLRRNFQGYTDDSCDSLIGLGSSSISQLPQGYLQTMPATGEYMRLVPAGGLATVRGTALNDDDHARGWVIERLMCDFGFDGQEVTRRFGANGQAIFQTANVLAIGNDLGFRRRGDRFELDPESAHRTARLVAAEFDAYLGTGAARHSVAM
ncbi:oxygen-independent coproporphyrinogen-3 oxidase [Pararhizobium capsulatum DSM 1112]|uniref:Coproporphyrinogen-III oxidase n=1 Tax=Pararhizobium capsulatum DSM 1112 TaxID=1121113 RepID=A0ABU0BJL8_9HYPH|nr:oxygen-independent coproporphyrinogen III oxidase [Pararhizobium capsulatum]MDQ0318447.1 oxygen-independent coproporphyrinogen-3 oxidase [Pararhizobium capsulatum DSM 1112]